MSTQPTNRLGREKSPYLRQHATNPVDWYPWGDEAFARAKGEDKPIFLSIGYATCHWCHVMAHESFADESVAALLNAGFVSIKVDREERPDIDGIYMRVCQMLTGSGGWPLTIVMTPEKEPFFAATYIPKESRWGRTGLIELLPRISEFWRMKRPDAEAAARQTVSLLSRPREKAEAAEVMPERLLEDARAELQGQFDDLAGGFGEAPKFPMPHQLIFLLRFGRRRGDGRALEMALKTLRAMRRGGICDQLGFGFHRYSTDRQWLIPHFEKMLYDQALLLMAYTEAFQATGEEDFARAAREVSEYVLRDLTAAEGGFYAAEDADSEGEEGRFYLWTMAEIRAILGEQEALRAAALFGMAEEGNFVDPLAGKKTGENILLFPDLPEGARRWAGAGNGGRDPAGAASGRDKAGSDAPERREAIRRRLLAAREGRVRPQRDEKILTDWNGLMIAALARAARVFREPRYRDAARGAADFILSRLRTAEGRLLHRYCDGEAAIGGHLDDYAFLIWGLIECYATDFTVDDLRAALALQRVLAERFRDPAGGYFFTPDDGEALLVRLKEGYDGAVPSGNAVTLLNLIRLGRLTGDPRHAEAAAELVRAFAGELRRMPSAHAQWLAGLDLLAAPSWEVVIAGSPGTPAVEDMLALLRRRDHPGLTVLFHPAGDDAAAIEALAPFTRGMGMIGGRAAAYLCRGFSCRPPVTDPGALAALLAAEEAPPPAPANGDQTGLKPVT